jgi:AsmA protein
MADGAINGINIPQMIRGVTQGKFSGFERTPAEKTDFSDLAASWTITNGVAQNQDLRASSPMIRLAGAGSVNLGARTLDYVVRPKIVANLSGQGADTAASGLEIPVKITGPWDKPSYAPDINGILKDPNQAIEAAKQIGKNLKGSDVEQAIKGALGDGDPQQRKKAREQLRSLFQR